MAREAGRTAAREADGIPEPDHLSGTPHPREQTALVGHSDAEAAFLDGLGTGRLHHAWLLGGPFGIGKATLAYRVAQCLLAHDRSVPDAASLDLPPSHPVSRQVAAQSHPDLAVIRRGLRKDGKGYSAEIAVDHVRRALDLFSSTAGRGGYRVCIVDSADDLNASSANALLKVIEEPPPRSVFLIVAHAPQRVLPTIRSRCRRLLLRPLSEDEVRAVIGSLGPPWTEVPEETLGEAVRLGEGSVRRALAMLDPDKIAVVAEVTRSLDALPRVEPKRILALAESLQRREADENYELVLDTVERWLGRLLHERAELGPARLAPLVEVCDKVARSAREIDAYNLDRRPLVLALFDDLAEAVRRAA
jgi:DNA polymerase-3 subunit delta'